MGGWVGVGVGVGVITFQTHPIDRTCLLPVPPFNPHHTIPITSTIHPSIDQSTTSGRRRPAVRGGDPLPVGGGGNCPHQGDGWGGERHPHPVRGGGAG
ncbi:MAG: hypothetical protein K0U11_06800 [Gammaproteobacteria bacterium]|nr:hypothetical protein [Gammaproteobacteria bacterium]